MHRIAGCFDLDKTDLLISPKSKVRPSRAKVMCSCCEHLGNRSELFYAKVIEQANYVITLDALIETRCVAGACSNDGPVSFYLFQFSLFDRGKKIAVLKSILGESHVLGVERFDKGVGIADRQRFERCGLDQSQNETALGHTTEPASGLVVVQAHQQLKEELGLDHFEGRSWTGLHRHALMTMMANAFLQCRRIAQAGRKKESVARRRTPARLHFCQSSARAANSAVVAVIARHLFRVSSNACTTFHRLCVPQALRWLFGDELELQLLKRRLE